MHLWLCTLLEHRGGALECRASTSTFWLALAFQAVWEATVMSLMPLFAPSQRAQAMLLFPFEVQPKEASLQPASVGVEEVIGLTSSSFSLFSCDLLASVQLKCHVADLGHALLPPTSTCKHILCP